MCSSMCVWSLWRRSVDYSIVGLEANFDLIFLKCPSNILMEILVMILLGDPEPSKQLLFLLMGLSSSEQIAPINYLKSIGPGLQQNICNFA